MGWNVIRLAAAVAVFVIYSGQPLAHAGHALSLHRVQTGQTMESHFVHRSLPSDPNAEAFWIGFSNGVQTSYGATIYGDGHVSHITLSGPVDAHLRLSRITMNGLLKLAEAVHFFSLPPTIGTAPRGATDLPSFVVTVDALPQRHTVTQLAMAPHRRAFCELFSVLAAASGLPTADMSGLPDSSEPC